MLFYVDYKLLASANVWIHIKFIMNQGPVTKTRDFHVPNVRAKLHSLKNLVILD